MSDGLRWNHLALVSRREYRYFEMRNAGSSVRLTCFVQLFIQRTLCAPVLVLSVVLKAEASPLLACAMRGNIHEGLQLVHGEHKIVDNQKRLCIYTGCLSAGNLKAHIGRRSKFPVSGVVLSSCQNHEHALETCKQQLPSTKI